MRRPLTSLGRGVFNKLNELPKQIFMLLPLLLHWLYFFILGKPGPSGSRQPLKDEKIKPMRRQQHQNLRWQFIQLNIPLPRDVKGLNILLTP